MWFFYKKTPLILIAAFIVFVVSTGVVIAQEWQQPPGAAPGASGAQNVGPVLFSGDKTNNTLGCTSPDTCGGGEAQARTGALRIGDTFLPTEKLEVGNNMHGTNELVAGRNTFPGSVGDPVEAIISGYAGAPYNAYLFGVFGSNGSYPGLLASGYTVAVARVNDGTVMTWGREYYGELGNGGLFAETQNAPVAVSGPTNVIKVAAGQYFALAVSANGTVWSWGRDDGGQLGDGGAVGQDKASPVQLPAFPERIVDICAGFHVVAVGAGGHVWSWGNDTYGKLGNGLPNGVFNPSPIQIPGLEHITQVSCFGNHTLALDADGTVWSWGRNDKGQLGIGSLVDQSSPVKVANLTNVKAIAAGNEHSLALTATGEVWAWGSDIAGQLGTSAAFGDNQSAPTQVTALSNVRDISAGVMDSFAVLANGTTMAWGADTAVQLGDHLPSVNSMANQSLPVPVQALTGSTDIAGGDGFTFARTTDGLVWAWGSDANGNLGNGAPLDGSNTDNAVQVLIPPQITSIYAGIYGATSVASGFGVVGNAGTSNTSTGVYADAAGANGIAIQGRNSSANVNSYSAYFTGRVTVTSATAPALDVEGDVTFENQGSPATTTTVSGNLSVPNGTVYVGGVDLEKINALSVQNPNINQQNPPVPAPPGVQYFSLTAEKLAANATQTFTTGLGATDYLTRLSVLYRTSNDAQARWKVFTPPYDAFSSFRQCSGFYWKTSDWLDSMTYEVAENRTNGHLFVGTYPGGDVYLSINEGNSWTPTTDMPGVGNVWSTIVTANGTVLVGTGAGTGIFRSINEGTTWASVLTGEGNFYTLFQARNGNIYAGTYADGDVYRSTDDGQTWVKVGRPGTAVYIWDFSDDNSGNLYVGTETATVYVSSNNGDTWSPVTGGALPGVTQITDIMTTTGNRIYAGTFPNGDVFYSDNGGASWTPAANLNDGTGDATYVSSLLEDSNGWIYAGAYRLIMSTYDSDVFRSKDGGTSWEVLPEIAWAGSYNNLLQHSNGHIYSANGGRVYSSSIPMFLPDAVGSVAIRNSTGVLADFRVVGSYIPGVNACP